MQLSRTFNDSKPKHPGHRDGFKPQRKKRGQFTAFVLALCLLARS